MESISAHQRPSSSRPTVIGIDSTVIVSTDLLGCIIAVQDYRTLSSCNPNTIVPLSVVDRRLGIGAHNTTSSIGRYSRNTASSNSSSALLKKWSDAFTHLSFFGSGNVAKYASIAGTGQN